MAKKKDKPKQDEIGDVWMLTYSDLMTLLTCFFLLLMVFANYEEPGKTKAESQQSLSDAISKTFTKEEGKSEGSSQVENLSNEFSKHPELLQKSKMTVNNNELQITFASSVLFNEASTEINENIEPMLQTLIDIVRSRDISYRVLIEGHADPFEHLKHKTLKTAWEIGAMRAAKVIGKFEEFGFDPNKLAAISKGDLEPLELNKDENGVPLPENMVINRRVVIRVIEPITDSKKFRFGLGIYFNEKLDE